MKPIVKHPNGAIHRIFFYSSLTARKATWEIRQGTGMGDLLNRN